MREPFSVSTRTLVAADRTLSCGNGVTLNDEGMSYAGSENPIRSHSPSGEPATPSAQAVSGLPSKALTGSNCGRWNSQLPLLEAVTARAPRSTAVVW